jgi:hypothetical protein
MRICRFLMYVFLITSEISYHSILYLDKLVVDFVEQFNEKLFIKQILDVSSLLKLSLVCAETTL